MGKGGGLLRCNQVSFKEFDTVVQMFQDAILDATKLSAVSLRT